MRVFMVPMLLTLGLIAVGYLLPGVAGFAVPLFSRMNRDAAAQGWFQQGRVE